MQGLRNINEGKKFEVVDDEPNGGDEEEVM